MPRPVQADIGESPYLLKPVARRTFLRHVRADMRRGEEEIRESDLDWTIFRPPSLTGKAARGACSSCSMTRRSCTGM